MMTTTGRRVSRLTEATIAMALAIFATALLAAGCSKQGNAQTVEQKLDTATTTASAPAVSAQRGQYLVTLGGCNDCHTPLKMGPQGPEPDMSLMLSGHPEQVKMTPAPKLEGTWMWGGDITGTAFTGPWGTSYAMNLTPDSVGGIGTWSEEMFINTLRSGKHWGTSRPIMPPMPWFNYAKASDEDLKSIYAYLRTIPAVRNTPPAYEPPVVADASPATKGAH